MKKLLKLLGVLVLALVAVLLFNTFTLSSELPEYESVTPVNVPETAVEHFQKAITFQTVSYTDRSRIDTAEFRKFQAFVKETYPLVDSLLDLHVFNHTLSYTWQGKDAKKPGVVLMGHYDVVPVDSSTMDKWEAGPFSGGVKDNVIPTEASVVVNSRIMPGETGEDVLNHIKNTVMDDRITIEPYMDINLPTPVSDDRSDSYKLLEKTILELMPGTVVTPGLLGGGTDSKHFIGIADNVYRSYPMRIEPDCMNCFHGNNEHISLDNFREIVQFCYLLIRNLNE